MSTKTSPAWLDDHDFYPKKHDREHIISLLEHCLKQGNSCNDNNDKDKEEDDQCNSNKKRKGYSGSRRSQSVVGSLSHSERKKLLHRYFPKFVVDIYCTRKTKCTERASAVQTTSTASANAEDEEEGDEQDAEEGASSEPGDNVYHEDDGSKKMSKDGTRTTGATSTPLPTSIASSSKLPRKFEYEIPHDELIEALLVAPSLVVEETPMDRYLVHIRGSDTTRDREGAMKEAAHRIAMHWKFRKCFFRERAFFPMAQTPIDSAAATAAAASVPDAKIDLSSTESSPIEDDTESRFGTGGDHGDHDSNFQGALSREDMEWLKTGYSSILPSTADPKNQRSVCIVDVSQLPLYHNSSAHYDRIKIRVAFYFCYLFSRIPATQKGLVLVSVISEEASPYFGCWGYSMLREAFPIKHVEIRYLFFPSRILSTFRRRRNESSGGGKHVVAIALTAAKMIGISISSYFIGAYYHFGYNDESVVQKLVNSSGFNLEDIPTWIGGHWGIEKFHEWRKTQLQSEINKYTKKRFTSNTHPMKNRKQQPTTGIEREQTNKRRIGERLNCKQLQAQVHDLKAQGARIRYENECLENLLEYAKQEAYVLNGLESEVHNLDGNKEGVAPSLGSMSCPSEMEYEEKEQRYDHRIDIPFPRHVDSQDDLDLVPEDNPSVA